MAGCLAFAFLTAYPVRVQHHPVTHGTAAPPKPNQSTHWPTALPATLPALHICKRPCMFLAVFFHRCLLLKYHGNYTFYSVYAVQQQKEARRGYANEKCTYALEKNY